MPDLTVNGVPVYRDSAGVLRENAAEGQIADLSAQLAGKADAAAVPKPANTAPMAEKTGAAIGGATSRYALEDHQHPRLTSTTVGFVAAGNTATIVFTRTFASEPGIVYQELPPAADTTTPVAADTAATAQPTQSKVIAWTKDANGAFTGCTIRVWKAQTVPQNLATVLLGGVFNLFAASVVGTRFSIIAIARSDV